MINKFKKEYSGNLIDGVYYLTNKTGNIEFEDQYIKLRTAEGRLYDDETVSKFPHIATGHQHYKEWRTRSSSSAKLVKYLKGLNRNLIILELGCGNGWLSNMLSKIPGSSVIGIDINEHELKQASRIFGKKENLVFAYADIFNADLKDITFDVIVLAGVMMYFDNIDKLISTLKHLLSDNGVIHLIDNALYDASTIDEAKKNTRKHYEEIGLPEMSGIIHHHLFSEFEKYNPVVMYDPNSATNKIKRKIPGKFDSPFVWMRIDL